jgi:hypothetical protein
MTSLDEPIAETAELVAVLPETPWERFEGTLARLSDRLNPILVKEARQALRSRQFTTTLFLMLAAGWTWSMLGLALLGPAAYYNAEGQSMFFVYYVILAAPLLIVIPYYAYHSLSAERQDRTYELLSITALSARHILTGKLCASGLQMMVYLSALFPCLAFTYLLRGLDIFSVFLVVAYSCLLSLGLAMLGLLLATLAPSRQRQIVQGILFAVLLCYVYGLNLMAMAQLVATQGMLWENQVFWESNASLALLYLNAFALVFLAARSLLTTACQNRSTALRVALVVAQLSLVAWIAYAVVRMDRDAVYGLVFLSTAGWFFAGALMVGESPVLSPRVRRGLPQSAVARVFFTWFAPGPGTGYMFAVTSFLAVSLLAMLLATDGFRDLVRSTGTEIRGQSPVPANSTFDLFATCLAAASYLAIYLGLGKLILAAVRRFDDIRISLRVLVHTLLILAGAGIPWVLQITYPQTRNLGYTLLQITNPVWTLWEYCMRSGPPPTAENVLVLVLPATALVVWGLNLPGLAAELRQVRIGKPPRVAEADAQLAAAKAPAPVRSSPWDD